MKKQILMMIALLCMMAQGTWADKWDGVTYEEPEYQWKGHVVSNPESQVEAWHYGHTLIIHNAAQMAYVMKYFCHERTFGSENVQLSTAYYDLEADIDMGDWKPLGLYDSDGGNSLTEFTNLFDGHGHTIRINIKGAEDNYQGLFARISKDGWVRNLHIAGSIQCSNSRLVGGIAGENDGLIQNCWVSADVSSDWKNSSSAYDAKVGGITGENSGAIQYCCVTGNVKNDDSDVGGIVGCNNNSGTVDNCTFYGVRRSSHSQSNEYIGDYSGTMTNVHNSFTDTELTEYLNSILVYIEHRDMYITYYDLYREAVQHPYSVTVNNKGSLTADVTAARPGQTVTLTKTGDNTIGKILVRDAEDNILKEWSNPSETSYTFEMPKRDVVVNVVTGWTGSGTAEDPYLIPSKDAWENIHTTMMESSMENCFENTYFKQTADIDITQGICVTGKSNNKAFCGTYNGDGHKLNCQLTNPVSGSAEAVAPFHKLKNATIKNLTVEGSVQGGIHSAGLAAYTEGDILIYNCRVKAHVTCGGNNANDAHGGGFIGHAGESKVEMWYNMFDGKLGAVSNGKGDIRLGAFVGWSANNVKEFYCVEKGTYLGISNNYNKVAFNWKYGDDTDDQSSSYNLCLSNLEKNCNVEKARKAYSDTYGLTVNIKETPEQTWANGGFQTNRGNNFFIGDEIYSTKTVHFTTEPIEGKELKQVFCNSNEITPEDGLYTVDMEQDKDAVITATFKYWTDEKFCADDFIHFSGDTALITTPEELALLAKRTNEGNVGRGQLYSLANDLDMSAHEWKPIGIDDDHNFKGEFYGQGHTISGIRILSDDVNVGLFGYNYVYITDVRLSDSQIQGRQNVGGIAGTNTSILNNCYVDKTVTVKAIKTDKDDSGMNVGGITGLQRINSDGFSQYVTYCYSAATVEGDTNVGGIDGSHSDYVEWCVSEATVTGNTNVGGISGNADGEYYYVMNSISAAQVSGNENTGALVGLPYISDYYNNIRASYFIAPAQKMNVKDTQAFPVVLSDELVNAGVTMRYERYIEQDDDISDPYTGLRFYNSDHTVFSLGSNWYAAKQADVNFFLDTPEGYNLTKVMVNGTELEPAEDGHYTFNTGDDPTEFVITVEGTPTPTDIKNIGQSDNLQSDDDAIYDLSGRKVANGQLSNAQLPKGIYIQNGKKVVIKK